MRQKATTLFLGVAWSVTVLFPHASTEAATATAADRARIEAELMLLERDMLKNQALLEDKQLERQSIERDVSILESQINKAQLGIKARAYAIEQIADQIGDKEVVISVLDERLEKQRQSVAELIRKTEAVDDFSLVEILLSNQNFSGFFTNFESYRSVNDALKETMDTLKEIKHDTEDQKLTLIEKQQAEAELKKIQELEKKTIEQKEAEKSQILKITKGQESAYQELIATQQKTAAQLRAALFQLLGGSGAIPFPEAVALAKYAGSKTGVSPALLLAIVEQESNYGSHIGSCVVGDIRAGKSVMHPERDAPVFLAIADILGFDAATQRVSCPITGANGQRIGWGGAMGPLQFIPSTWAIYGGIVSNGAGGFAYSAANDAIRTLGGKSLPANPFDKQDAFMASALLLRDNGANGAFAADRLAALRYYAGWGGASNPANQFYGDQVMERKARLEGEIKILDVG